MPLASSTESLKIKSVVSTTTMWSAKTVWMKRMVTVSVLDPQLLVSVQVSTYRESGPSKSA